MKSVGRVPVRNTAVCSTGGSKEKSPGTAGAQDCRLSIQPRG
jgi:hypothetical protein